MAIGVVLGATSAATAQSAFTTGTIASSERAGYGGPYEYQSDLYDYVPGHRPSRALASRLRR